MNSRELEKIAHGELFSIYERKITNPIDEHEHERRRWKLVDRHMRKRMEFEHLQTIYIPIFSLAVFFLLTM